MGSRLFGETRGVGKVVNKPQPPERSRAKQNLSPSKREKTPAADFQQQIATGTDTATTPQERISAANSIVPSLSLIIQPDERAVGYGWSICNPCEEAEWSSVGIEYGSVLSFLQEENHSTNSGSTTADHDCDAKDEATTESCSQYKITQLGEDFHRQSLEAPLVC